MTTTDFIQTATTATKTATKATGAFIAKLGADTGAFAVKHRKALIITSVSIVAGAAIIAGAGIAVINGIDSNTKAVIAATASATPAASATPKATAPAAPKDAKVGDTLDKDTALSLRQNLADNGDYAYNLNGQWVKINRFQPLPAAVQADVNAKAAAVAGPADTTMDAGVAAIKAAESFSGTTGYNTGKSVIFITQLPTSNAGGPGNHLVWEAVGAVTPDLASANEAGGWASADAAKAAAEASVSGLPNAGSYVVVVR